MKNQITDSEMNLIFNTDWNKGTESTMNSLQRARIHDLYLIHLKNTMASLTSNKENKPILTEEDLKREQM